MLPGSALRPIVVYLRMAVLSNGKAQTLDTKQPLSDRNDNARLHGSMSAIFRAKSARKRLYVRMDLVRRKRCLLVLGSEMKRNPD
jgi:hypothetical protein